MDSRVRTLNQHAKEYDRDLFFKRDSNGVIHLFRTKRMLERFEYQGVNYASVVDGEQHIFSLTIDWQPESRGVDWGIDPVIRKIVEMGSWRDGDSGYEAFCRRRKAREESKKRAFSNEIRARAEDMRLEFARATNDIVMRAGHKRN